MGGVFEKGKQMQKVEPKGAHKSQLRVEVSKKESVGDPTESTEEENTYMRKIKLQDLS